MKQTSFILLFFAITFSCCESDEDLVELLTVELDCEQLNCPAIEEFYGIGLMNGECWMSDFAVLEPTSSFAHAITLSKSEMNGISEGLSILINKQTHLSDTIWLGWGDFENPVPNVAQASYFYQEDHSLLGEFDFTSGKAPTYKDFLLIDYINEDTSIIQGRFQLRFSRRSVSGFVTHAPDTIQFQCGSFRTMEL